MYYKPLKYLLAILLMVSCQKELSPLPDNSKPIVEPSVQITDFSISALDDNKRFFITFTAEGVKEDDPVWMEMNDDVGPCVWLIEYNGQQTWTICTNDVSNYPRQFVLKWHDHILQSWKNY